MSHALLRSRRFARSTGCLVLCAIWACSEAKEAERVELRVVADGSALTPVTTDLGYEVELSSASMAVDDLKFTIAGEVHTSLRSRLANFVLPAAHAHPGHFQGGEVTGELPGHFVLHFVPGEVQELGIATLLVGNYKAVNLTLSYADSAEVEESDPLAGHTAVLTGNATRDDTSINFEIVLDAPEGRDLVGVPFEEEVMADTRNKLALQLTPLDPLEMDTLFDGVDFAALDGDADGRVAIDPAASDEATVAAYNLLRRTFQTHDHFVVRPRN